MYKSLLNLPVDPITKTRLEVEIQRESNGKIIEVCGERRDFLLCLPEKAPIREFTDDYVREIISLLPQKRLERL